MSGHALPDGRIPVPLSAHDAALIGDDAAAIRAYLARRTDRPEPAEVAATLAATRPVRRHRAVARARDTAELATALSALATGDEHPLVARSSLNAAPRTAFVCPGQGAQWPSMGAQSYQHIPSYRNEVDRCTAAFAAVGLPSPLAYLTTPEKASGPWSQPHVQGAHFTHVVALAQVWRSHGVSPDITVGHSLGEVAAAYLAGAITLPEAAGVVAARATVLDTLPGEYGMAVLGTGVKQAQRLAAETAGWLEVSVVNSPSSTVLSGERDAVCAVVRLAENYGVFVRQIDVDFPAHTSALDPLRPMFARMLPAAQFTDVPVECIAASTGAAIPAGTKFGDHWDENLRNTVRFDQAIQAATQRGAAMFIELSAHPSLQYALTELADGTLILGSGRRDQPIAETLSANIAAAAVADPGHRWTDTAAHPGRPVLRGFPNAPMHAWHLWAGSEPATGDSAVSYLAERWQPQQPDARVSVTSCGLAVVAPEHETAALASALEQAAARLDCRSVPPAEAEIVVVVAPPLTHPDPLGAAGELGGRPGAGLPDYRGLIGPRCRGVWLLTFGGEQVGPEDPTALPAQAALAAMHRCAGFEFPDQVFAHLDLPADGTDVETAAEVLLGPLTEVALRGRTRYTRQLREHGRPSPRPLEAAALENVVITGGSGAIGLHYARHCIAGGARRVILLSRGGIDAATLAGLTEGHRAQVHAPKCDINDPDALSAAASACAGDGASLLIHAAGIARFGPQQRIGAADLAAVFGAKVAGLSRMADIWPLRADARILLCSSVSGVWGGHGHGAYAAANRMLDIAATRLRAAGHDATAVRWGLWQDTTIADADEIARIERAGLAAMDPVEAIDASLRCHDGDPLIVAADIDRLRVVFESQGGPTLVDAASGTRPEADVSGPVPVAEAVRGALAAALSLPGTDVVDPHTALIDLGVDSLLALDLRKRLRASTGRTVALARLLGGITGAELIDELQPTSTREGGVPA